MFTELFKAATALVATPVALAADLLTLPANDDPFRRTGDMLNFVGDNFKEAIKVEKPEYK